MGFSRDTFYRYPKAVEDGGVDSLLEKTRRKPNVKNRTDVATEKAIMELSLELPAYGQVRMANELRKKGMVMSPAGIRCVQLRHGLENTKKRLKALEEKVAKECLILTEKQIQALEKKQIEDSGEVGQIETQHPGYLGSQDTYYVGTIKGVGRIYQQTFVDTYTKVAFAKLYTMKPSLVAADLLNDKVLPFFESHNLGMLRILTDRGTESCGTPDEHDYPLYLAMNDIDHTRTKARSPQTNGICECFHRTIKGEFYGVVFRKKIYKTLEDLQKDLDDWLTKYNHHREHQGKMCNGRTPMQTLLDSKHLWVEKVRQLN